MLFLNIVDGIVDKPIRLVNSAFAYVFTESTLSTTGVEALEQTKHCGRVSSVMTFLRSEDGDLKSYFDMIEETENGIKHSLLHRKILDNQEEVTI